MIVPYPFLNRKQRKLSINNKSKNIGNLIKFELNFFYWKLHFPRFYEYNII